MVMTTFTKAAQGDKQAVPNAPTVDPPIKDYLAEKSGRDLVSNFADSFKNAHDEGTRRHENDLLVGVRTGLLDPTQVNMRVNADAIRAITQEAQKAKQEQSNSTFMFLALLDQLEAQIVFLEERIEIYNGQIEALDDLIEIEKAGEIDPTDPDHQRLLEAAGIPRDEWGTVTLEDLEKRKAELEEARDRDQDALNKKKDKVDHITQRGEALKNDPAAQSEFIAVEKEALQNTRELLIARKASFESDIEWFEMALEELSLDQIKGTALYNQELDRLIGELSEDSKQVIFESPETDMSVKERIGIALFNQKFSSFDEFKNDPSYVTWVKDMITDEIDNVTKHALLDSDSTPEEFKKMIAEILAEESGLKAAAPSLGV